MIQFLFCDTTEVVQAGHERRYQKDKDAQHKSNQGPLHLFMRQATEVVAKEWHLSLLNYLCRTSRLLFSFVENNNNDDD
jgi:high-affinity nickel permease